MEENLSDIIQNLLSCGLFGFIMYIIWIVSKLVVVAALCKHPEMSDEKVKYITHMISKNKH